MINPAFSDLVEPTGQSEKLIYMNGSFKLDILRYFSSLTSSDKFVDVGVNVGQTMLEVMAAWPYMQYFGFEPNPQAFCIAKALANANNLNVKLFPWACSNRAAPQELYSISAADSSATTIREIRPDTYQNTIGEFIAAYTLDEVFLDHADFGFMLKIDVEGAENEVLEGASALLTKYRPLILCEVLHAHRKKELRMNNWRKKLLYDFLVKYDYEVFSICVSSQDRDQFRELKKISGFTLNTLWSQSPHTCDFVFLPKELV